MEYIFPHRESLGLSALLEVQGQMQTGIFTFSTGLSIPIGWLHAHCPHVRETFEICQGKLYTGACVAKARPHLVECALFSCCFVQLVFAKHIAFLLFCRLLCILNAIDWELDLSLVDLLLILWDWLYDSGDDESPAGDFSGSKSKPFGYLR